MRSLCIYAFAVAACGVASTPFAAPLQYDVSVSGTVEYDSNPRLKVRDRESVWRAILTPGLTVTHLDGSDELYASAKLRLERSTDDAVSSDRNDPSLAVGWRRATERGGFGLGASYARSTTRLTELDDSGLTAGDNTRTDLRVLADWNRALTERLTLSLDGSHLDTSYDESSLADRSVLSAGAKLSYELSPVLKPFASLSASRSKPDDEDASHQVTGLVGLNWQATERLDWSVHGGLARISNRSAVDRDETEWQAGIVLHYAGNRTDYTLDMSRATSANATTTGDFAVTKQVRGTWSYALDERTTLGAYASRRDVDGLTTMTLYQLGVWLSRELAPDWQLRLMYTRKEREESGLGDASANVIGLTISYRYHSL